MMGIDRVSGNKAMLMVDQFKAFYSHSIPFDQEPT